MPIIVANSADFSGIRRIWEEQFTTEPDYLNVMFSQIIPLCTNYICKEGDEILSVASFMPMHFYDTERNLHLDGYYMFGVATLTKAQGRKLAVQTILHASNAIESKGYQFIFERPANQGLNNYYLKLGFTAPITRTHYRFLPHNTIGTLGSNMDTHPYHPSPDSILTQITQNFSKAFIWKDTAVLQGLINLGEVNEHNTSLNSDTLKEEVYIAIKTLNGTKPEIFSNVFFCFPME